jgi:hypothetical protein
MPAVLLVVGSSARTLKTPSAVSTTARPAIAAHDDTLGEFQTPASGPSPKIALVGHVAGFHFRGTYTDRQKPAN